MRCVQCGYSKEKHQDGVQCPAPAKTTFASMELPGGATCSDCVHLRRCMALIGNVAKNTSCDWFPIRFVRIVAENT